MKTKPSIPGILGITALVAVSSASLSAATLLHHWKLDDAEPSAVAIDSGTTPSTGTVQLPNDLDYGVPGAVGTAAFFRTDFTRIELGNVAPTTGTFTMSLWFKVNALPTGTSQADIMTANSGQTGRWALGLSAASSTLFFFHNGGGPEISVSSFAGINDNLFHLFTVTRDSSNNLVAYLDGGSVKSQTDTGSFTNSSAGVWLGRRQNFTSPFNGTIDDVRIYDDALSPLEVAALVPEPSALALLGLGGLLLARRRRR